MNRLTPRQIRALANSWFTRNGEECGRSFFSGNLEGTKSGRSFRINLMTGSWHDHSQNKSGNSLISLLAFREKISEKTAENMIADMLSNIVFIDDPHGNDNGMKRNERGLVEIE